MTRYVARAVREWAKLRQNELDALVKQEGGKKLVVAPVDVELQVSLDRRKLVAVQLERGLLLE